MLLTLNCFEKIPIFLQVSSKCTYRQLLNWVNTNIVVEPHLTKHIPTMPVIVEEVSAAEISL